MAEDGPLDPEVVGDHPQRPVADRVRAGGGDLGRQVDAVGARLGAGAASMRAASSSAPGPLTGPKAPGMEPASRRWRVRRRVSIPARPGSRCSCEEVAQAAAPTASCSGGAPARGR